MQETAHYYKKTNWYLLRFYVIQLRWHEEDCLWQMWLPSGGG